MIEQSNKLKALHVLKPHENHYSVSADVLASRI